MLARNRISSIQSTLPNSIPSLTNLVLSSNNLTELSDLDVLGKFSRLTQLVLMDNPVTKKEVRFLLSTQGNLAQGKGDEKVADMDYSTTGIG